MTVLQINGFDMPCPQKMTFSYGDIGQKDRNAAGQLIMDRVAIKRTVHCFWSYLSAEQAELLLEAVHTDLFMSVTLVDPRLGARCTADYYRTEFSCSVHRSPDGFPTGYSDVKLTLAER